MVEDTIIGIDVGTTTVKALLLTTAAAGSSTGSPSPIRRRGRPAASSSRMPTTGSSASSGRCAASSGISISAGCKGIGICSQVNTHVFVGADGEALAPAIVWQDGRCAGEAAELDAQVDNAKTPRMVGRAAADRRQPLPQPHGLDAPQPSRVWDKTRWVMAPKDYCVLRLTGEAVADPIASVGLVDRHLDYLTPLLDLVPGAAERLAPLQKFTHRAGKVSAGFPCAGTPVVVGTMDAWGGMFGVGVHHPGRAMYLSGTSEILGIVSPQRVPTPGVIAFPTYDGITLHAGPTQSGGASMMWLGGLLGKDLGQLSDLVAALDPAERAPLFLPHLQGERAPLWDVHARGVFVGLDASSGPAHLAKSVMEGVGYSARLLLDALEQSADCTRRADPLRRRRLPVGCLEPDTRRHSRPQPEADQHQRRRRAGCRGDCRRRQRRSSVHWPDRSPRWCSSTANTSPIAIAPVAMNSASASTRRPMRRRRTSAGNIPTTMLDDSRICGLSASRRIRARRRYRRGAALDRIPAK